MPLMVRGVTAPTTEVEGLWPIEIPDEIVLAIKTVTKAFDEDLDYIESEYIARHANDLDMRVMGAIEFRRTFGRLDDVERNNT